jgi:hypothetical protein
LTTQQSKSARVGAVEIDQGIAWRLRFEEGETVRGMVGH